jgi:hypothetical protein
MLNLLKKIQLIQFLIIILFFIISSKKIERPIIDKSTDYYNYLIKIMHYNNLFKKNNNSIEGDDKIKNTLENVDYLFYFYNKHNVSAIFFKNSDSDKHHIYFNGIKNIKDISLILKIFSNNFTFKNIEKLLNKGGRLYTYVDNKIEEIEMFRDKTILDVYDYIHANIYSEYLTICKSEIINLQINGYSFGGPLSQIFIYIIYDKYGKECINIENYNIESWFSGSKDDFEDYKKIVKFYNIYNKKSVLYFYNILFQKHFEYDYLLDSKEATLENDVDPYIGKIFPNGLIKYVKDNHILKKIIK